MKKLVLFTFDYELFLGRSSGQPKDCILDPTNRLLQLLNRFGFRGIFFVDTVYLMRLTEVSKDYSNAMEDLTGILEQLARISKQGHYIYPHIHPHWIDAEFHPSKNEWSLQNIRYYKFSSLSQGQQQKLFEGSFNILRSVLSTNENHAELDGYRAGGWSIQPFEYFKPYFQLYGIRHEFSVIPGKYQRSDTHYYDFTEAPANQPIYRFSDEVCSPDQNGMFTEWTISVLPLNSRERWIDFKVSGLLRRLRFTGNFRGSTVTTNHKIDGDINEKENTSRYIASFEGLNPYRLGKFKKLIKSENYFHFISHPKLLNDFEFRMISKLFSLLSKIGQIETDFRKVSYA